MTIWIYALALRVYYLLAWIFSFFNRKANLWIKGRKSFPRIKDDASEQKNFWFHIASLGEYEQAWPVMLAMKSKGFQIIITFFSPSGFELKKKNPITEHVFYLPLDTPKNAKKLIDEFNPVAACFVKYDLWYFYINELVERKIPVFLISAKINEVNSFRKRIQWKFNCRIYKKFNYIFAQDAFSSSILSKYGISNNSKTGDTRIDSVLQKHEERKEFELVRQFAENEQILILGSSYHWEESIAINLLKDNLWKGKLIIAPHQIEEERLKSVEASFAETVRFSRLSKDLTNSRVLIVDNIGLLKHLYAYSQMAIIGGGFKKSIHNTLEPAAYGIPIFFGPNYFMFTEANEMIKRGGAFSFSTYADFVPQFKPLLKPEDMKRIGAINKNYMLESKGASQIVIDKIMATIAN